MKLRALCAIAVCVGMVGCASRRQPAEEQAAMPPHTGPICIMKAPMPVGVKYASLGEIKNGKQWYGGVDEVIAMLADQARTKGADAVVSVRASHKIGFWAWSRPVAYGTAVKLERAGDFDCKVAGGELR